jgi:hypothetical protein
MLMTFYPPGGRNISGGKLATGWKVQRSNPSGDEIFRARPVRSCDLPSLLYNEYLVFPGGKNGGGEALTTHPI